MNPTSTYPLTPLKNGVHHLSYVFGQQFKRWIPIVIGMSGIFFSSCAPELELTDISVKIPGEVIIELPNMVAEVKVGQTQEIVQSLLKKAGYVNEPQLMTIKSNNGTESDCGDGAPTLWKTYLREGVYNDREVEFHYSVVFTDNEKDGKCDYRLKLIQDVKVREPSYMKEMYNAKNN